MLSATVFVLASALCGAAGDVPIPLDGMTIVVVKLSSTALRKNVTKPTSHIKVACFFVRISEVITSKPPCPVARRCRKCTAIS